MQDGTYLGLPLYEARDGMVPGMRACA
jgi:hypothetical protein